VLCIEDNDSNLRLVSRIVEGEKHEFLTAVDGVSGLALIRRERPDLVLLDINIPGLNGLELARQLKDDPETTAIPLIAMTANAMLGDRERCLEAGMDGYVSKPVRQEEMFAEIARCLPDKCVELSPGDGVAPSLPMPGEAHDADGAAAGGAVLDRAGVVARLGGDEALFETVAEMFVQDAPGYIEGLLAAAGAGDAPRLQREAHTCKGLLTTFSWASGGDLAREIEKRAAEGDVAGAAGRVPELVASMQALAALLAASGKAGG